MAGQRRNGLPGTCVAHLLVASASLNGVALSALGLEDLGTGSDVSHGERWECEGLRGRKECVVCGCQHRDKAMKLPVGKLRTGRTTKEALGSKQ